MTTVDVRPRFSRAGHTWRVVRKVSMVNLRARMQYRGDFLASILFGILWQTSTLIFAGVLLTHFHGLAGFPTGGVLLIIGMRLLSHGLYVLIFANLEFVPMLVDQGRMDGYFLRPFPVFTQVLLGEFNINALGDIAVGATSFGFALTLVDIRWDAGRVAYLGAAIIGGVLVEAALQLTLSCLLLRSPASWTLSMWVDELMSTFGNYPLSILPGFVQGLFTFVLPIAFVSYFPVTVLLGIAPRHGVMSVLAHWSPAVGFLLFFLARRVWSWSLRHYRTAGG
jgi:ABC-2 type transport system permease protein